MVEPSAGRLDRRAVVKALLADRGELLVIAGLFMRNLQRAQWIDLGFDQRHLLIARMDPGMIGSTMRESLCGS